MYSTTMLIYFFRRLLSYISEIHILNKNKNQFKVHRYFITVFVFPKTKQELFFVIKIDQPLSYPGVTHTITRCTVKIISCRAHRYIQTEDQRLIGVYTVAIPFVHLCRHHSMVEQK